MTPAPFLSEWLSHFLPYFVWYEVEMDVEPFVSDLLMYLDRFKAM